MHKRGKPRTFEDKTENEHMRIVSPPAIDQLKLFLFREVPSMKLESVIELGCGRGHVTRELLVDWFKYIDLLDQCEVACGFARELEKLKPVREVINKRIQDFDLQRKYNCILFRFCIGYFDSEQAPEVLKQYAELLHHRPRKRSSHQPAYILV